MKNKMNTIVGLMLLIAGAQKAQSAQGDFTDRIRVSGRVGYFIDADIQYGVQPVASVAGTTPDGDPYNYDNGYLYPGSNGGLGGGTWYWGYEDAAQIVGNTIELTRTVNSSASSEDMEMGSSTEFPGIEVFYSHQVQEKEGRFFGFDFGASYQPIRFAHAGSFTPVGEAVTDAYEFYDPSIDPMNVPALYKGTFNGPGFILRTAPVSSTSTAVPGTPVSVNSEFHGSLWGIHIGPYMDVPLNDRFFIHASGGLSLALLDATLKWDNSGVAPSSGSDQDYEFLGGAFLATDLNWYANDLWMLSTGVRFEHLTSYENKFDGHTVNLDLSHTLYWTFGVVRNF